MESAVASTSTFNNTPAPHFVVEPARRLRFVALVSVIFFTVSGGAFGIESLVGTVGAGLAVVLIIITPLLWSLPIALMVSELSSAMPEEGGYYVWVRRGLGDFWGVQEGWWTICYTAVDMAIYPVLFVNYLAYFVPSLLALDEHGSASWTVFLWRWLIAVTLIVAGLGVNWRGARDVGRNATFNVGLVLVPFALLAFIGLTRDGAIGAAAGAITSDLANRKESGLLALGLATVMWNYCGWDNVSTFAAEVDDAPRNYPRALLTALPLTVGAYLLPVLAGLSVTTDAAVWSEAAGWPVLAQLIAGPWLGLLLASAALVSAWSLFNSQLLYVSRLPFAMACDGWLPALLARVSPKTGVPTAALVASCTISALFAALPFGKLVIIDILLYSAALSLEFAALLALRRRRPEMPRPFRVPGGWPVLVLMTLAPMSFAAAVVVATFTDPEADPRQAATVVIAILSGIALYYARRRKAVRQK
ncbi:MAG: APC family permease [Pyrinomonadaceae bacterium]|nr:APC family permease [Pyrinomonadaceae bacterium]